MVRPVVLSIMLMACFEVVSAQPCFSPLQNPKSTDTYNWKDLVNWDPDVNQEGVVRVQRIADGLGPINLDFYSITFAKHQTRTINEVFLDIRKNFEHFAHSQATLYGDESDTYFLPYRGSAALDDRLRQQNKQRWESTNPKDAVMTFVLASHTPALALAATLRGIHVVMEQGDVVATCANPTDFIFSTVYTEKDQYHPVNGNRGFGIRDNQDGTWTFYSKGADRETKVLMYGHGVAGAAYFGNELLKNGARDPIIPKGPDAVFQAGHMFWLEFFANLVEYLSRQGMKVKSDSFVKNSQRYPYPLTPN